MPDPVLSPEMWGAVKAASLRGVLDDELAASFGINKDAIRMKRSRDAEWKAAYMGKKGRPVRFAVTNTKKEASEVLKRVVGENLETIAQNNPLIVARYTAQKIREAIANDSMPVPGTWKDFSAADSIVRRATGLDKPQAAVQLNVWQGTGGPILREVEGVYDVETAPIESQEEEE